MSHSGLRTLNKVDFITALTVALFGLVVYTRVLAPDVLYSDSGEFQTLAYTWGTTHTTGYPVYLVLARIISFIPIGSFAWRISFASAVFAAVTLGGVYLIVRHFVHQNGALFASLVLLLSYTFWSQSIIAEVYTPATAFIVVTLLVLLQWYRQPLKYRWVLVMVGFLVGIGLGIHLFILLIAPPIFLFVLSGVLFGCDSERKKWSHLFQLILGGIAGLAAFYVLFVFIDTRLTPTNIFTTAIDSSRETWGLQASDLDSEPERFWISVSGYQWRDRMVPTDVNYGQAFQSFLRENLAKEYAGATVVLSVVGLIYFLLHSRRLFLLFGTALGITFSAGFLYFPGDKFIFYLPFYVLLAILSGVGLGFLTKLGESVLKFLPSLLAKTVPVLVLTILFVVVCTAPFLTTRLRSLERGYSGFVSEDYVYPVLRPHEARDAAECALSKVTETDAFLVLDWRALYSIYYVAHVEQGRTGIVIREALPYPAKVVAQTLQTEISEHVRNGDAVYVDDRYTPLTSSYQMIAVAGCTNYRLFKLSSRS